MHTSYPPVSPARPSHPRPGLTAGQSLLWIAVAVACALRAAAAEPGSVIPAADPRRALRPGVVRLVSAADSGEPAVQIAQLGPAVPLRWLRGPVSLGMSLNAKIVSWSGAGARDLFITRCWEGAYLYPTHRLASDELNRPPVQVSGSPVIQAFAWPVDWDKDGIEDVVVWDRCGFFYTMRRKGTFPQVWFELDQPLRDKRSGLVFNIPWDNPNHPVNDSLGGYIDPYYYNHSNWITYPLDDSNRIHWIIGDWGGNLWWLPDVSDGKGPPQYTGTRYVKPDSAWGGFQAKFGREYVKPSEKIADPQGRHYRLGTGADAGVTFDGGNTRPVLFRNQRTGAADLLVIAGQINNRIYYLKRAASPDENRPVFENLGEVKIEGLTSGRGDITSIGFYSMPVVCPAEDGFSDLLFTVGNRIAVLKNKRLTAEKPEFAFDRYVEADDTPAGFSSCSEILTDGRGGRYLLENGGGPWSLYRLEKTAGGLRFVYPPMLLEDQNGVFRVEGETDPQGGKDWGFHRAAFWDYDGGGMQHLVVGTDKGLLYLLMDGGDSIRDGKFRMRSAGPLKDAEGHTIRIHNRAVPAAIDLDADGRQDLVVGGASYQQGIKTDPRPGGGFYWLRNRGLDPQGLPILASPVPLETRGHHFATSVNTHLHAQAVDLDRDGRRELVLSGQDAVGHVFTPAKDGAAVEFLGRRIPGFSIEHFLVDLEGSNVWELVFAGGEQGVGHSRALKF